MAFNGIPSYRPTRYFWNLSGQWRHFLERPREKYNSCIQRLSGGSWSGRGWPYTSTDSESPSGMQGKRRRSEEDHEGDDCLLRWTPLSGLPAEISPDKLRRKVRLRQIRSYRSILSWFRSQHLLDLRGDDSETTPLTLDHVFVASPSDSSVQRCSATIFLGCGGASCGGSETAVREALANHGAVRRVWLGGNVNFAVAELDSPAAAVAARHALHGRRLPVDTVFASHTKLDMPNQSISSTAPGGNAQSSGGLPRLVFVEVCARELADTIWQILLAFDALVLSPVANPNHCLTLDKLLRMQTQLGRTAVLDVTMLQQILDTQSQQTKHKMTSDQSKVPTRPVAMHAERRDGKSSESQKEGGLPSGLWLVLDFISPQEEQELVKWLSLESWRKYKLRQVLHYGFAFDYSINNVDTSRSMGAFPPAVTSVVKRLALLGTPRPSTSSSSASSDSASQTTISATFSSSYSATELLSFLPDQLTVNKYEPGQGIPSHVDTHSMCYEPIVSLSLGSGVVMDFTPPSNSNANRTKTGSASCPLGVWLPSRSLLIMAQDLRYGWTHGIAARKADQIEGRILKRRERISLTFRRIRIARATDPCGCAFAHLCDSQSNLLSQLPRTYGSSQTSEPAAPSPNMTFQASTETISSHPNSKRDETG
eukprot:g34437.t1